MKFIVVSGGQTGADQGGLLGAQDIGVETGGWVPYKFLTENGSDYTLQRFGLKDSYKGYAERTRMNVRDSNITLWFGNVGSAGGCATKRACIRECKPFDVVTHMTVDEIAEVVKNYIRIVYHEKDKFVINIAGNRESNNVGLQESTRRTVRDVLAVLLGGGLKE